MSKSKDVICCRGWRFPAEGFSLLVEETDDRYRIAIAVLAHDGSLMRTWLNKDQWEALMALGRGYGDKPEIIKMPNPAPNPPPPPNPTAGDRHVTLADDATEPTAGQEKEVPF